MQTLFRIFRPRLFLTLNVVLFIIPTHALAQAANSAAHLNLDACIAYLMSQSSVPGISLSTIENGSVQPSKSYGYANHDSQQPITKNTVLEAASLSKPVLAFIVLKLVEEGQLSLDKPLHEYLPYSRFNNQMYGQLLTARLVLSHQTGLPNWGDESLEFNFPPGTEFGYSGEGYVYLQKVLEKITGLGLQQLAQREVFAPLGMKNSYFSWNKEQEVLRSMGHNQSNQVISRQIPEANAASSLHTTAHDYALFVKAWMQQYKAGNALFKTALAPAVLMKGDERGAKQESTYPSTVGWGLGWGVQSSEGKQLIWHWGDNGVFRAFVAMDPDSQNAFVLLTNSQNGLAMAAPLAKFLLADMQPAFGWLNYESIHSPGWSEKLQGYQAEARQDFSQAATLFAQALDKNPEDKGLARRVKWLQERQSALKKALPLTEEQVRVIPGTYGPRKITREGNILYYQRGEGKKRKLRQIKTNLFMVESVPGFRLQVMLNEQGLPEKLIGHYLDGWQDESPRSPDLMSILLR